MSYQNIRLAKNLKDFRGIQKALKDNLKNEYDRGLYNGLEMAWSLMNNKDPVYAEKVEINPRK